MLTLDEMHECITTYLRDGGYEDGVWMPSVKYDTGASTRFPVYGITYSNTAVPMVPPSAKLEIAEGWTLCGGMEHGDREILPKIWLKDNNQTRVWYTEVANKQDLLQYLQSRFPTGQVLADTRKAANVAIQATRRRAEQEILYDTAVRECVLDEHVKTLVESSVQTLVARGLSLQIYPKLKERLLHHLTIKLSAAVSRDLDAVSQE